MIKAVLSLFCAILTLSSCTSRSENELRIAASSVPHAELLEFVKSDLKYQGIDLKIIVTDDYNTPNRALADGEVDANFFQHLPFLEEQIKQFNYPLNVLAKIEIEPMGLYSKKVKAIDQLKNGATVGIPNDPTNEARALQLLQSQGLIQLDRQNNSQATVLNIVDNPKHLKFIEVDAAMLPRSIDDIDLAAINTNYALAANLNPIQEAIVLESSESPYVNVIVIRNGDEGRPAIQALKAVMTSEKMREFINKKYHGAVLPAF